MKKKNALMYIIIVIMLVGVIALGIYAKEKNNKLEQNQINEKNDNENSEQKKITEKSNNREQQAETKNNAQKTQDNTEINLSNLKAEIIDDSNASIYLETCYDDGKRDENGIPNFVTNKTILSAESLDIIFSKLKQAKSIELLPTGKTCPSYTFKVTTTNNGNESKIIIIMYSDDKKSLLVGIKGNGYVYHYENESELYNLLEGLE